MFRIFEKQADKFFSCRFFGGLISGERTGTAFMVYFLNYLKMYQLLLYIIICMMQFLIGARKREKKTNLYLVYILLCILTISVTYYLQEVVFGKGFIVTVLSYANYVLTALTAMLYLLLSVKKYRKSFWIWIPVIFTGLAYSTMFYCSDLSVWYSEKGTFVRKGIFAYTIYAVIFFYILLFVIENIRKYRREGTKPTELGLNLLLVFTVILYLFLQGIQDISLVPENGSKFSLNLLALYCLIYYLHIYVNESRIQNYEKDIKIIKQQSSIMLSQIQPHFLYNTLATIRSLCKTDPQLAADTITDFSAYLRHNIDSMDLDYPIPFEKELKHTETYAAIEMLRFDNVHVTYDIRERDFRIPALTLQPMVENAVKHGVRARENGMVHVQTYKEEKDYIIEIQDNGVGFDTTVPLSDDQNHVGLQNVRQRIEIMCGGTLTAESTIGEGTTIIIRIPEGTEG